MKKSVLSIFIVCITTGCIGQSKLPYDSISNVLEKVFDADQTPRLEWDSIAIKFGYYSKEFIEFQKNMMRSDSVNTVIVSSILDRYGWLGKKNISEKANKCLFLVVQHADQRIRDKYLPLMRKAVDSGNASAKEYAYVTDRSNMEHGKFQVYGTQLVSIKTDVSEMYPIIDEPNVDKRRKQIGLKPLAEYTKGLLKYNYQLPKIDKLKNKFIVRIKVNDSRDYRVGLSNAEVSLGNGKVLGVTDAFGFFQIALEKKYKSWAFIIKRKGFKPVSFVIENISVDFFEGYYGLNPI